MKALNFLGHPVFLCLTFLLILVSGEAFGGPYILYLVIGLPHGASYAILGAVGLLLTLLTLIWRQDNICSPLIIIGLLLMIVSIYQFFSGDRLQYNQASFKQPIPVVSITFFAIAIVSSLIKVSIVVGGQYSRYRRRSAH